MSTGLFTWFDLMTSDVAAASAFYAQLFGWEMREFDFAPGYPVIHVDGIGIGGIAKNPAPGVPSHWLVVLTTDDLDGSLAKTAELGGRTLAPPMDIPGVGRYAVLADPHGAAFCLLQPLKEEPKPAFPKGATNISWSELMTPDAKAAIAFYNSLLGWPKPQEMQAPPGVPAHWLPYVDVQDCDATASRVPQLGGKVWRAPDDIPGVGRFAVLADPTGATFAIMQSVRKD